MPTPTSRLEARLPKDIYTIIKRAAQLSGRSISDFVVSAAHEKARKSIEEETIIRLAVEDQLQLAKALINPPKPNKSLSRAFDLHRKHVEIR